MNLAKSNGQALMTIEETAEMLNVKVSWLRSAVFRREIPYVKIGNLVRFRKNDTLDWIEQNRKEARQR